MAGMLRTARGMIAAADFRIKPMARGRAKHKHAMVVVYLQEELAPMPARIQLTTIVAGDALPTVRKASQHRGQTGVLPVRPSAHRVGAAVTQDEARTGVKAPAAATLHQVGLAAAAVAVVDRPAADRSAVARVVAAEGVIPAEVPAAVVADHAADIKKFINSV